MEKFGLNVKLLISFMYDNTKNLHKDYLREDIHYIGVPMIGICMRLYQDARQDRKSVV